MYTSGRRQLPIYRLTRCAFGAQLYAFDFNGPVYQSLKLPKKGSVNSKSSAFTLPQSQSIMTSHVSTPASANYEELRRRGFNDRIPDAKPAEIVSPNTTADVVEAVQRARQCGRKIGVRSGGHHFFHPDLVENGMLIDTRNLNKSMEFDPATKIATISPGHTVEDLAGFLGPLQRFFPSGHSRSVGVGGFLLAGGQGLFVRGWGYTSTNWVKKIEVVTSEGEIVIASKTENPDLSWAMPGSGQGFFAVITRIWIKTIPNKRLFDVTTIMDSTDIFKPLLKWVLTTVKSIPKYGAEPFFCTFYADKDDPEGGEESKSKRVFFVINQTMFADSLEEAKVLASPWAAIPDEFERHVITTVPLMERDREELWELQENFQPSGNGERWNVDSILADPEVSDDEVKSGPISISYHGLGLTKAQAYRGHYPGALRPPVTSFFWNPLSPRLLSR